MYRGDLVGFLINWYYYYYYYYYYWERYYYLFDPTSNTLPNQRATSNDSISIWIQINLAFAFYVLHFSLFFFFFFFFFVQPAIVDKSIVNSAPMHCSRVSQITLFNNFFIKNWSHSTIYTFKNYFTIVFSVAVFNFSKNKLYPNVSSKWMVYSELS